MADNKTIFQANPVQLDISRSKFDLSHVWSGTFNAGICIPTFAYSDVLPGDTFKINSSIVVRSTTPVAPTMDQLYCDVYYFFVPHKMVLGRESMSSNSGNAIHSFEAFIGAQDSLLNMPLPGSSVLPVVTLAASKTTAFIGSFADYIGVNGYGLTADIDITPFEVLAYAKVWNDYFRDPNTMTPITYTISGSDIKFFGGTNSLSNVTNINDNATNLIQPGCRYHGYFGSALPWPQRNSTSVTLPLGNVAPVVTKGTHVAPTGSPLEWMDSSGNSVTSGLVGISANGFTNNNGSSGSAISYIAPSNLYADLANATAASVNAVRLAFATQKYYEALSRAGNRLQNVTGLFGVTPHDLTSDVPEYLGGRHFELNLTQVANTAGTTYSTSTQQSIGSTGAYSLTADKSYICTKSFDTWGTIVSIMIIRPHESFSQGIHRRFFRDDRLKYYWPQFANLGEQYIYEKEIFADGSSNDNDAFGYQEAWSEYRFLPDVVTGLLRPGQNMFYWTYANNFATAPTLAGYINGKEIYKNVDQTLQVSSTTAGFQFMAQVKHAIEAVRPMPTYSIPGLIDHH